MNVAHSFSILYYTLQGSVADDTNGGVDIDCLSQKRRVNDVGTKELGGNEVI